MFAMCLGQVFFPVVLLLCKFMPWFVSCFVLIVINTWVLAIICLQWIITYWNAIINEYA